jgi:hypothetical protein
MIHLMRLLFHRKPQTDMCLQLTNDSVHETLHVATHMHAEQNNILLQFSLLLLRHPLWQARGTDDAGTPDTGNSDSIGQRTEEP